MFFEIVDSDALCSSTGLLLYNNTLDRATETGRGGAAPGRLRAAQDVGDVLPAAVGERVDASSELPRDLVGRRAQTTVSAPSGRGLQDRHA